MKEIENEVWQPVPYEPYGLYYEISSFGRIKKKARNIVQNNRYGTRSKYKKKERLKKLSVHPSNHYYATLRVSHEGKDISKTVYPHRMVAEVFVPKPKDVPLDDLISTYKDRDFTNIHYTNIEWLTKSEVNKRHHREHPENKDLVYLRALEKGTALTRHQHALIKKMYAKGDHIYDIADYFNVTVTAIRYHCKKLSFYSGLVYKPQTTLVH